MPRRTAIYQKIPWSGGLNFAVDPGVLPDDDLTIADNVVFSSSGSRLRREGLTYIDEASAIPAVISRSSSGVDRTLVFASSLITSAPDNQRLVEGEQIRVVGGPSNYNTAVGIISAISTTTNADDTITYTFTGAVSLSESPVSTGSITVSRSAKVLDVIDYWRTNGSSVKVQETVAVTSQQKFFVYDSSGRRSELNDDGTTLSGVETKVNSLVMNERLIWAFAALGDKAKKYRPESDTDVQDLAGSPPDFSMMRIHQGRLWTNNKTNKDRLEYSSPGNPEEWNGTGDSGAIDIEPGDGDADGITAIFPPFKGALFVAKGAKLYQISGDSPENYRVDAVSSGVGCVNHKSVVAVDQDDIVFVSQKGVHSLAATAAHGDFEGEFLSSKIQPAFNKWDQSKLKFIQAVYDAEINSVAFSVTEAAAGGSPNDVWLLNVNNKQWYQWPDISCESLGYRINVLSKKKILMGTNDGRVIEAQNGTFTDFGTSGYEYKVRTGTIYPDGSPVTIKGFKKLGFLFRPKGDFQATVRVKIDNQAAQYLSFEQEASGDLLGSTFVLGASRLGVDNVLAPYMKQIDGFGRGCVIEITQSGTGEQLEIYGVIIEYESADIAEEVDSGS